MAGGPSLNAYMDTQIKTATREQLLIMLFDGAIRFSHQAKAAIIARNLEQTSTFCLKVQNIMTELMSSLDKDLISEELFKNLLSLYAFVHKRMVSANLERNPAHVDEALVILDKLRGVWQEAVVKALDEHGGKLPPPPVKTVTRDTVSMKDGVGAPDTAGAVSFDSSKVPSAQPAPATVSQTQRAAAPAQPAAAKPSTQTSKVAAAAPFPIPTKPAAQPAPAAAKPAPAAPTATPAAPASSPPGIKKPKINLSR